MSHEKPIAFPCNLNLDYFSIYTYRCNLYIYNFNIFIFNSQENNFANLVAVVIKWKNGCDISKNS